MARIELSTLEVGRPLSEPLYDKGGGQLLLAQNIVITPKLLDLLARRGIRYGYVHKDDSSRQGSGDKRLRGTAPISGLKDSAERNSISLHRELDAELQQIDLDPEPGENPILAGVDDAFQGVRSEARFRQWRKVRHQGATLIENVVQGSVAFESIAEIADKIADSLLDNLCNDNSLMSMLALYNRETQYLFDHSMNRTVLAANISIAMGYDRDQVKMLIIASLLADIGMPMVPKAILNLPRSLTASEFVDVQKHSVYGVHAVTQMRGVPYMARFITYQLHERSDGSGYPKRRGGELVCRFAKIVAVADAYHALINERPWRRAYHPYRAVEMIIRDARKKLDPDAVRGLLHFLSLYPIGTLVQLSSGEIGKVVHANGRFIDKPVVTVFIDRDGTRRDQLVSLDLSTEEYLSVTKVIEQDMGIARHLGFVEGTDF